MDNSKFKIVATNDVTIVKVPDGVELASPLEINSESKEAFCFKEDPINFELSDFRQMIASAAMSGCHDLTIKSSDKVKAKFRGNQFNVTRRVMKDGEIDKLLVEIYGSASARSDLNSPKPLDFSCDMLMPDGKMQRFRVNATGVFGGVEVTMRVLSRDTPTKEMVGLSDDLVEAMSPDNGIVIISGETGSGKSTTLAALIREHILNVLKSVKIVDFQAPIEYTYTDITNLPGVASVIGCSEIGRHLESFAQGIHTALRRNPDIICVGESRDPETIRASLLASITGHLVYTTTHAGSVGESIMRMLSEFPHAEMAARANEMSTSLRLVMVQRLIPREDVEGKFVPVREYLKISDRIRRKMASTPLDQWQSMFMDEVSGRVEGLGPDDLRQSTRDHVSKLAEEGVISRDTAMLIAQTSEVTVDPLR